jgi:hypothetical protein
MRVDVQRDRRIAMAELSRDVQDRHAIGQQQRRERVAHLVRPAPMEAGCIQDAVERFCVRSTRRAPGPRPTGRPTRERLPERQPVRTLPPAPEPELGPEPPGQVEPAPPVILRRRQLAADDGSLQLDAPPAPVDVTPLKRTTLASAHSRAERSQHPRVPLGEVSRAVSITRRFLSGERIHRRFRFIARAEVLPHRQRGIRREVLILDSLSVPCSASARCRAPSRLQSLCAGSDGPGRGGGWSRLWTWRRCTPRSVS